MIYMQKIVCAFDDSKEWQITTNYNMLRAKTAKVRTRSSDECNRKYINKT